MPDVDPKSDAAEADKRALPDAYRKGCFPEQSFAEGVIVGHRLKVADDWHEA